MEKYAHSFGVNCFDFIIFRKSMLDFLEKRLNFKCIFDFQ